MGHPELFRGFVEECDLSDNVRSASLGASH
jgi:hypothetical protein